jgi:DNA (cytosine-5)-methyltransferase 1
MDEDIATVRARLDKGTPYKSRLVEAVALRNWPTPTATDGFTDKLNSTQQKEGSMHSVTLPQAVQMWPTPRSNPAMASLITSEIANDPKRFPNLETVVGRVTEVGNGGRLNPTWVEWLMGFPTGWTDLDA